ncbi:MAG: hypothetical protein V4539_23015 [Bacteroidota bacterium]
MKKLVYILFYFLLATNLTAQTVLKVTEIDESKRYLQNGAVRKEFINSSMVDINSTLRVEIDTAQLFTFITNRSELKIPDKIAELIGYLTQVLQQQNRVIAQFKRAVNSYDPSDPALLKQFNDTLQSFGRFAQSILIKDPLVRKYQNALPAKVGLAEGIFIAVSKRIDDLQAELSQLSADKKNSIQLGAWLHAKTGITPIHLPGYDELPEKGYYSVNRWQILPTDEQMKQLQQLQSYARENRDEGLAVINTMLQKTVDQLTENISVFIKNNLQDIESAFASIKADIQSQALQNKIEILSKDYTSLVAELRPKIDRYQSWLSMRPPPVEMLAEQLILDGQFFTDGLATFVSDLKAIEAEIVLLPASIKSKADALRSLIGNRINSMVNKLVPPEIKALIEGYKFDMASLDYSDKVLKLSLNAIPVEANLDLGTTGRRSEGDRILLKLNIVTENNKSRTIDTRDITMYQLAVHTQGTVGVIFAHPTATTAITKQFQMAPYYNLLFKSVWPWTEKYHRRSAMNNSFWDFSWGLHVSTPDFNKDDIPELGVGIAISGIRDILQVGFAHNIFENKPYFFFGIRLPVPSMNFGGSGHSTGN